jgi:hypothetical protein
MMEIKTTRDILAEYRHFSGEFGEMSYGAKKWTPVNDLVKIIDDAFSEMVVDGQAVVVLHIILRELTKEAEKQHKD